MSGIVWEINAETEESLINSLEKLAYSISQSEEERVELSKIQKTEKYQEKNQKIIVFIKKHLKKLSGWLLIYDNVTSFHDIQHYFPDDPKSWGLGNIIITTQNYNITYSDYIKPENIIEINELNDNEKLTLFVKIRKNDQNEITYNTKEIYRFLKNIPSFPLDVSLTAHFLKHKNISYVQYLEHLKMPNGAFIEDQKYMLEKNGYYNKTRYDITVSSLNNIIVKHKDFRDILLFVGLLDSQNIPINILHLYKDRVVVNKLLSSLQEYSLIQKSAKPDFENIFSIHRSTQQIMLSHLITNLKLEKNYEYFKKLEKILEDYMTSILDQKKLETMRQLIPHIITFLSHKDFFDTITATRISHKLAQIYFFLGQYEKTKELLEIILSDCRKQYGEKHIETASVKRYLGHTFIFLRCYEKAKINLEESLKVHQKHYGEDHIETALVKKFLGHTFTLLGKYKEAKTLLEDSLKVHQKQYGEHHIKTALVKKYLGYPYVFLGYYKQGKDVVEQSLKTHQKQYGEEHIETIWVKTHLGRVYTVLERYEEAKVLLEESLKVHQKHYGEDHIETAWVKTHLGRIYTFLRRYDEAKVLLEESLIIHQKQCGKNHSETSSINIYLKEIYAQSENSSKQIFHYSKSIHSLEIRD